MNPLQGVRILDLSRLLPGPYATQLLADLGADVIKVERPPEGDYARAMPPFLEIEDERGTRRVGAMFARINRGKRSIALDFSDAPGRDVLRTLVRGCDVLVESFRPGTLARHGLGFDTLRELNPRLIYCSLSGFGQRGPFRNRAGHDLNYLALAGILKLNGTAAGPPIPPPVQIADLAGGTHCALQTLAALLDRVRTGMGRELDVSLFGTAVSWMESVIGAYQEAEGTDPHPGELPFAGAYPCYNIYETADHEHVALGALEAKFWENFCIMIDRPDLVRRQYDAGAIAEVADVLRQRTRGEWTALAGQADVCLDPLLSVSEAVGQAQVRALLADRRDSRSVPRVGEHTAAVLAEAGIDPSAVSALEAAGIIECAS